MKSTLTVLTCLLVVGHGRRLQTSHRQALSYAEEQMELNRVAKLMLASKSAAAFVPLASAAGSRRLVSEQHGGPRASVMSTGIAAEDVKLPEELGSKPLGSERKTMRRKSVKLELPESPDKAPSILETFAGTKEEIESSLQSMKVAELKSLVKLLGHKPGSLRKAELVALCAQELHDKVSMMHSQVQDDTSEATEGQQEQQIQQVEDDTSEATEGQQEQQIQEVEDDVSEAAQTQPVRQVRMPIPGPAPAVEGDTSEVTPGPPVREMRVPMPELEPITDNNIEAFAPHQDFGFRFPTGHLRNARFDDIPQCDMTLTFLGTASCSPSASRGTSCINFQSEERFWLFDCGEGSQGQLGKTPIKPSKIKKVFLTHLHGDHAFGLAGILCAAGQSILLQRDCAREQKLRFTWPEPIDIYGPEGTRDLVRAYMQLSYSFSGAHYKVHELKNIPSGKNKYRKNMQTRPSKQEHSGEDIFPDENGHYHLFEEGELSVKAASMVHTVPCVGYVIQEKDRKGHLKPELVREAINRNSEALRQTLRDPMRAFRFVQALQPGESYTFPDGTALSYEEVSEPDRPGRKIVIMGDTSSGGHIAPLAQGADIVVHEATNALLFPEDYNKYGTYDRLERETINHGHSTPEMAGRFVKQIGAKRLILTHFSSRYSGSEFPGAMEWMWQIEDAARKASHLQGPNDVIAAWDFMALPIKMH